LRPAVADREVQSVEPAALVEGCRALQEKLSEAKAAWAARQPVEATADFPTEEPAALREHSAWAAAAAEAATQAVEEAAAAFTAAVEVAQLSTPVATAQVLAVALEVHRSPALRWSLLRITRLAFAQAVDWQLFPIRCLHRF
jgi:hypothetical protein